MPDDYTADTNTRGAVSVGGSATGEIETARDVDWFAVTLEADTRYRIDLDGWHTSRRIELEGWDTGRGTLRDTYLRGIHDVNGILLPGTTNDDGGIGLNSRVYFTPTTTGTYYVAAGAYRNREGTYTLSVADVTPLYDDFTATTGTTGAVSVGGSATGEIEDRGDVDWFAVTLEAGKFYRIDLEGSHTGAGTLPDPYLRGIYNAGGTLLSGTTNDDGGTWVNSRVDFRAPADGTYYVAAGAYLFHEGTYRLSVADITAPPPRSDDFTPTTGTTGEVSIGGSATGEIETARDQDWFEVTLAVGRTYRIDLEGSDTGAGTLRDPVLRAIRDADGNRILYTSSDDGGTGLNSRVDFTAPRDGTYFVVASGYLNQQGTYRLSVADITPSGGARDDDFTDNTATTGAVSVGGSTTGEIDFDSETDWFAVTLTADRTYRIDLEGSGSEAGTLWDPVLRGIHDAGGTLIPGTTDDDSGVLANSLVDFTPTATGTYFVAAGGAGGHRDGNVGTYKLSVTDITDGVTTDDFTANTATTGTVSVGGSARGVLHRNDVDWFAVTLEANKTYQIVLEGRTDGAGTLRYPNLRGLYDDGGTLIPDTGSVGLSANSRLDFMATADGTYFVAVNGINLGFGGGEGTYTLSVADITGGAPDNDLAGSTSTTGAVSVGASVTSEIGFSGDVDWFAVTLEEGTTYRIDMEGAETEAGTLRDPYLRGIHDAGGTLLPDTDNDDDGMGLNSRVDFTAAADGTYYVAAGAFFNRQGTYTLSVAEVDAI